MPEFNPDALVDVNSETPAPSEGPELTPEQEANIEAAWDRFAGKASESDRETMSDIAEPDDDASARQERSNRRANRVRNAKREAREELLEDGLEGGDVPDVADEEPVTEEKETEVTDGQEPVEQKPAQEEAAPEFDKNLRYFAETELGWTPEKLDKLIAADPELAAETIQGFADAYTNLSRQLLDGNGSQVTPATQAVAAQPAQQESDSPTPKTDAFFNNLQAFAEANGEEVAEAFKLIRDEYLTPLKQMFAENKHRALELTREEARQEFTALSAKFSELYGSDKAPLTDQQKQAKKLLGETADQLRDSSKRQGRELSAREALRRAHLLVSAEYRDQIVRKEITGQVQKRSKSILAKPTQRRNPTTTSARSKERAAEAVANKAAELGLPGWDE